jgi:DNA invertase Pin-like site-specific DNA recombinase
MNTTKQKRVALYARVSTNSQTSDNQLQELRQVAERMNWLVVSEYVDEGISGAKGREQRPAFDRLIKSANRREFDLIASWSVDRLGRSLQHLVSFLGEIQAKGVDLYLHQQSIDTSTPAGKAIFQMCGVFAEFEREMIRERVISGIKRARVNPNPLKKTHGRPRVSSEVEHKIMELKKSNPKLGMIKIAKQLGVGVGTVQRVLN